MDSRLIFPILGYAFICLYNFKNIIRVYLNKKEVNYLFFTPANVKEKRYYIIKYSIYNIILISIILMQFILYSLELKIHIYFILNNLFFINMCYSQKKIYS